MEKLLTQLQLKYFTTLQPAVTFISHSERELDALMCLCVWMWVVLVFVAFMKKKNVFHLLSFFADAYASPPSAQRQAKVYYEVWIRQLFLFKSKFSKVWKEGLVDIWRENCFGNSTWTHFKTLPKSWKRKLSSWSSRWQFGDPASGDNIFYFISHHLHWACVMCSLKTKVSDLQECNITIKGARMKCSFAPAAIQHWHLMFSF